jgi:hypothetical protein
MKTIKKAQTGVKQKPATEKPKIAPKKPKTVSQRIGDTTLRDIKNASEDGLQLATLGVYGKVKKALGGEYKYKKIGEKKYGGKVTKAKNGTSLGMKSVKAGFDKNPGVTRADIITAAKGKAKSGATVKKAQNGTLQPMGKNSRKVGEGKYVSEDGNYKLKFKGGSDTSAPTSAVQRRTLKGFLKGAPKAGFKTKMAKSGTSMKKCKYGCK